MIKGAVNMLALVLFLLGACTIDSDSFIPVVMLLIGLVWLVIAYRIEYRAGANT